MAKSSDDIAQLRNLWAVSSAWLRAVGISTCGQLRNIGPVVAYAMLTERNSRVSLNMLWALAAGIQERDWRTLTDGEKQALRHEYRELKGGV
jgi:DNA transformation protein and related proteins